MKAKTREAIDTQLRVHKSSAAWIEGNLGSQRSVSAPDAFHKEFPFMTCQRSTVQRNPGR